MAGIAAKRMKAHSLAMVIGHTIHLHGASRQQFLSEIEWVRHEACHVLQYREYGIFRFLYLYIREYLRHGYVDNSFEVAARAAETDQHLLDRFEIH